MEKNIPNCYRLSQERVGLPFFSRKPKNDALWNPANVFFFLDLASDVANTIGVFLFVSMMLGIRYERMKAWRSKNWSLGWYLSWLCNINYKYTIYIYVYLNLYIYIYISYILNYIIYAQFQCPMDPSTSWEDTLAPKLYPKCVQSSYLDP